MVARGKTIPWRLEIQAVVRGAGHVSGMGESCWRCWDETELEKCCSQVDAGDSTRQEEKWYWDRAKVMGLTLSQPHRRERQAGGYHSLLKDKCCKMPVSC